MNYYSVQQFRYFGHTKADLNNTHTESIVNSNVQGNINELQTLTQGSIFEQYMPIISLGIQTLPGVAFYLNGSPDPIIVGYGGVFELDLTNTDAKIQQLQFSQESLALVENSPGGYLIIDIKYEQREEQGI